MSLTEEEKRIFAKIIDETFSIEPKEVIKEEKPLTRWDLLDFS